MISKLEDYLNDLIRNSPQSVDKKVFASTKSEIDKYVEIYLERENKLKNYKKSGSFFQDRVFHYLVNALDLPFISEVPLRLVSKVNQMTVVNDQGQKEVITIHSGFKLDGYFELTKELKEYLGLDAFS